MFKVRQPRNGLSIVPEVIHENRETEFDTQSKQDFNELKDFSDEDFMIVEDETGPFDPLGYVSKYRPSVLVPQKHCRSSKPNFSQY